MIKGQLALVNHHQIRLLVVWRFLQLRSRTSVQSSTLRRALPVSPAPVNQLHRWVQTWTSSPRLTSGSSRCHSPKPCSAIFSRAAPVPAWLHCLPCVWCCDKGPHGSCNDTVSPSPSRCSDRDCLNSILSRGRVPWQLHKYLPAAATPLRLRRARLQATSAMFFFCPFFPLLSLTTVVCVVLMISFGCPFSFFFFFLNEKCFY